VRDHVRVVSILIRVAAGAAATVGSRHYIVSAP
jgi:hypothetical protein